MSQVRGVVVASIHVEGRQAMEGTVMVTSDERMPLVEALPDEAELRDRLGDALREADLCRRMLRVIARRDAFRAADERRRQREQQASAAS